MFLLFSSLLLAQGLPQPIPQAAPPAQVQAAPAQAQRLPDNYPFEQPLLPDAPELLPQRRVILQPLQVRPLPGQLDTVPVFNSNSPEVIRSQGILLSTFPPSGKRYPQAHLNFPFQGRFDIFAHHIARTDNPLNTPTLYLGILLHNPSSRTVLIDVQQAASFLGTPDAPYIELPAFVDNPVGSIYSGPGSRVMNQVLRGRRQTHWPARVVIPPEQSRMLMNLPIPVPKPATVRKQPIPKQQLLQALQPLQINAQLTPTLEEPPPRHFISSSNARSTLLQLRSSGPVYVASMAMYAQVNPDASERIPTLEDWKWLLFNASLAGPRDIPPTPLDINPRRFFYGRVAGVSQGSRWQSQVTDDSNTQDLTIPQVGQGFAYGLSTLVRGTLGSAQVQSAPMLVRYPDTAYQSHGNYAVHYDLSLPLYNSTNQVQAVAIAIETPLKQDQFQNGLRFLQPPTEQVFFRGTVQVRYNDDQGTPQNQFIHLVQRRGQRGEPLALLRLQPGERRPVKVDFLYPPDATPPQVLTINTLANPNLGLPVTQNRQN